MTGEWWKSYFDEEYLSVYSFDEERTAKEVDFIVRHLRLKPGERVLDLGCGHGRIAIALAHLGMNVVGLDYSEKLLEIARRNAGPKRIEWIRGDMRVFGLTEPVDAIVCWFTTFGYFEDEDDHLRVLKCCAGSLRPGGRLLIETVNRDWAVANLEPRRWTQAPDRLVLEENIFDHGTSRWTTRRVVIGADGARRESLLSVRLFALHELCRLFRQAGLRLTESLAGVDEPQPYQGARSRRLCVIGVKS